MKSLRIKHLSRIYIIKGPAGKNEISLKKKTLFFGRADEEIDWKPDIDLTPDLGVSRKHARLFYRDGCWWIMDEGSKHGTKVGKKEIRGIKEPTKLLPGMVVKMGKTMWVFQSPNQMLRTWRDLAFEFQLVRAVNYSLYHCGMPIVSDFQIKNTGSTISTDLEIKIVIRDYSDIWKKRFGPLQVGEEKTVPRVHLPLHYEKLEGHEGRKRARLEVWCNDELVSCEEVHILGFYEWPTDLAYRKSLACFIQPSHPTVQNIILDAQDYLKDNSSFSSFTQLLKADLENKIDLALQAIYQCFKERYQISYVRYPPSYEIESQVIRPPHRVISNIRSKKGEGTCIDIALLVAACLENINLQPLIVFISDWKQAVVQHAFLGCWGNGTERFEPILSDAAKIKKALAGAGGNHLRILETTGFTDRFSPGLSFEEAVASAEDQFQTKEFLFALDVSASRQTVVPLQFPMSPGASNITRKAEELAREESSSKLEVIHLAISLLLDNDQDIIRNLELAGVNLSSIEETVSTMRPSYILTEGLSPRPTVNYRRAIEDARLIASDIGLNYLEKIHLWYALLLSQSNSVDAIFERMGTSRKEVRSIFSNLYGWTDEVVQTYYDLD